MTIGGDKRVRLLEQLRGHGRFIIWMFAGNRLEYPTDEEESL